MNARNSSRISQRYRDLVLRRVDGIRLFFALLFVILVFRLYSLQFLVQEKYAGHSAVERKVITSPVRGRIFDRNGKLLVSNEPYYRLVIDRSWGGRGFDGISAGQCRAGVSRAAELLAWDKEKRENNLDLVSKIYRGWSDPGKRTPAGYILLEGELGLSDLITVEEHQNELPGIRVEEFAHRKYYRGRLACHLLGYTGPIRGDYVRLKSQGYQMTDWMGITGLERAFDPFIKGKHGLSWQRRYANNIIEEEILDRRLPPIPGDDLFLSLDADLQALAEQLLENRLGGIAALDPQTGQILALASSPGYDLNLFRRGISQSDFQLLLNHPGKPFIDRSIGTGGGRFGGYPPGSIFKIVTAIAALEEGIIGPGTHFHCSGGVQVGRKWKKCWRRQGHGTLAFYEGFQRSCDVFFYNTGERVGPTRLASYARGLGLGLPTGLPTELLEKPGIIPDPAWKMANISYGRWGRGDTLNTAIGQGFVLTTPLQIAVLTSFVANRGHLMVPQLVSHWRTHGLETENVTYSEPSVRESATVSDRTLSIVREAMRRVVNERGGTGGNARLEGITVAGKTGTAEHYKKPSDAWFCCFAPYEAPEIAIAVVIEGGGHGGETAAPVAKALLEFFFADRIAEQDQVAKQ